MGICSFLESALALGVCLALSRANIVHRVGKKRCNSLDFLVVLSPVQPGAQVQVADCANLYIPLAEPFLSGFPSLYPLSLSASYFPFLVWLVLN